MTSNSKVKTNKSRGKRAKKNLSRVLKLIIVVLCFIGFVYNSFYTFKQFIGNQTVTSHNIQEKSELYLLYSIIPVFYHKGVKKRRIHFSAKTVLFHIYVLQVKKETSQWVETTLHLISNVQLRDQAMVVKNLWVRDHKVTSSRKWRCLDRFIGHSKVLKEKTRQKKKKHKPAAASSSLVYDFKKICFFLKSSAAL